MILSGLVLWVGATLLVSNLRWFARRGLADRLRPYVGGGMSGRARAGLLSVESFREAVGPVARALGERVARVFGVNEDVRVRLGRIHAPLDVTGLRCTRAPIN